MDSAISYKETIKKVKKKRIIYLLVAKRYWEALAKILEILVEYFTLFCSFTNKTYILM